MFKGEYFPERLSFETAVVLKAIINISSRQEVEKPFRDCKKMAFIMD